MATATKTKTKKLPDLTMKYAGGFVQHLGLHMYGAAVPAIAELIANAWDADATRVDIQFPFDQAWDDDSEIVISDNGIGMKADDVGDRYLVLGLDRRAHDKRDTAGPLSWPRRLCFNGPGIDLPGKCKRKFDNADWTMYQLQRGPGLVSRERRSTASSPGSRSWCFNGARD